MPNIELYGNAKNYKKTINELFSKKPYKNDYVITIINSTVTDHKNETKPFLRLVTTKDDPHTKDILKTLKILKLDIEVLIIQEFIEWKPSASPLSPISEIELPPENRGAQ